MNFDVYVDGSNVSEALDVDNKTTLNTFIFGDAHDILVTKVGHQDDNATNYVVQDPKNVIELNLPKKRVNTCDTYDARFEYLKMFCFSTHSF